MDFKVPAKKLLKDMNPNMGFHKSGVDFLAEICDLLNNQLVESFRAESNLNKTNEAAKDIEIVVRKMFKGKLAKFAMTEGKKNSELYTSGLIAYDPETELKSIKTAKEKELPKPKAKRPVKNVNPELSFRLGVAELAKPYLFTLHNSAKKEISIVIYNLAKRISLKAAETAGEKEKLELLDIDEALTPSLFSSPDILTKAKQNGMRLVNLFGNGLLPFKPKLNGVKVKRKRSLLHGDFKRIRMSRENAELKAPIFTTGLKKIAMHMAGITMDREALKLMDAVLKKITNKIAINCEAYNEQDPELFIEHSDMHQAVHNVFPELLASHSESEGVKAVSRFKTGLVKYRRPPIAKVKATPPVSELHAKKKEPTAVEKKDRKKKETEKTKEKSKHVTAKKDVKKHGQHVVAPVKPAVVKEVKPDFTNGIIHLLDLYKERPSISKEGALFINEILQHVCKLVAECCGLIALDENSDEVTANHVFNVVQQLFPPELAQHAIAEGAKKALGLTMNVQQQELTPVQQTSSEVIENIPSDSSLLHAPPSQLLSDDLSVRSQHSSDENPHLSDENQHLSDESQHLSDEYKYSSEEIRYSSDENKYSPDEYQYSPDEYQYSSEEYQQLSDEKQPSQHLSDEYQYSSEEYQQLSDEKRPSQHLSDVNKRSSDENKYSPNEYQYSSEEYQQLSDEYQQLSDEKRPSQYLSDEKRPSQHLSDESKHSSDEKKYSSEGIKYSSDENKYSPNEYPYSSEEYQQLSDENQHLSDTNNQPHHLSYAGELEEDDPMQSSVQSSYTQPKQSTVPASFTHSKQLSDPPVSSQSRLSSFLSRLSNPREWSKSKKSANLSQISSASGKSKQILDDNPREWSKSKKSANLSQISSASGKGEQILDDHISSDEEHQPPHGSQSEAPSAGDQEDDQPH